MLTNICCKDGCLPQGSPTSPPLSNLVNRVFDGSLLTIANRFGARYTRYADDLTFSLPKKIKKAEPRLKTLILEIKRLLKDEEYKIQYKKGIKILRPHQRQIITGLIVNEEIGIPRERKRLVRSMRHKAELGLLSPKDLKRLEGYELFFNMIEKAKPLTVKDKKYRQKDGIQINNYGGQINMNNGDMDIIGGDKITAGDNIGGIQNIGKFQNVVSNLTKSGNKELADAMLQLTQAITNSKHLSEEEKGSHGEALKRIGEEVTKEKPDKTILKYMWEGLSATLKTIPDIAKAIGTVAPLIAPFFM